MTPLCGTASKGGGPFMRSVVSILASVLVALILAIGLLALELHGSAKGASLGAAVAVAAISAFLLAYDVLKREERGAEPVMRPGAPAGGRAPVQPLFDPQDAIFLEAAPRSGIAHMNEALKDRRRDVVYVFRIRLGRKFEPQSLIDQLAVVTQQISPKTFVYLVKPDDSFVCFTQAETALNLLRDPKGLGLLDLISNGFDEQIKESYKELISFTLSRKSSSAEALGLMALKDVRLAMIVHEKRSTPIGPIDWATLATRVLRAKG